MATSWTTPSRTQIAARLDEDWERPTGADVGRVVTDAPTATTRYLSHLLAVLPNRLDGLNVVIDGAHGAASIGRPEVFRLAGATRHEIGTEPDGLNINDGYGSTHLDHLKAAVVEHGADLGIAHDGDADRCLAVDATGAEVDGDQIMAILAVAMRERGVLAKDTLVATVMSNLGLLQAMEREGIAVRQTGVGRPLRPGGDAGVGALPRRRADRPRHLPRPRHHRRRRADRADAGARVWPRPAAAWPTSPR